MCNSIIMNLHNNNVLIQTGREDKVKCFMCSLGFFEWQKNDVPWYQHSKLGSHCPYVKACKKLQVYHITEEMRKGRELVRKHSFC